MTQTRMTPLAWIAMIALALIWGGSFLAIRTALDQVPALTSVFFRTSIAAVALWGVILIRRDAVPVQRSIWFSFLVMGLLNNVIPFSLMAWGQLTVSTGLTSILNATTAIFGVLVAALAFADERLTWPKLVGACLGFVGVVIAIGVPELLSFNMRSLPQLAIITGTFSYALAGSWARKHLSGLSPLMASTGMLTMSSLVMVPLMLWVDGVPNVALAPISWIAILYYALIATAIAYLLYYKVIALAGAGNALLVTLLIPPVAILLGAYARNEVLEPTAFLGFACLAFGLIIIDGRLLRRWHKV